MPLSEMNKFPQQSKIASLAIADPEFNRWVTSRGFHELRDARGGVWRLRTKLSQQPHPDDIQASLYKIHLKLSSELTGASLLRSGIYQLPEDDRLLNLLGHDRIPLSMKAKIFASERLETLRNKLAEERINMRESLLKIDFYELKKRLVGEWIDRKCLFGNLGQGKIDSKIDLEV